MAKSPVIATFFGDQAFPVQWASQKEKGLFWVYADLHVPLPVSPMYASFYVRFWPEACEYMYRRFGAPFGKDWPSKIVNGYAYTAIVPREPEEAAKLAPYYGLVMPIYADDFLGWWQDRYVPEIERNLQYLDGLPTDSASLARLLIYFEDALDIWVRHFQIHWILNLAQIQASIDFGTTVAQVIGNVDPKLMGRIQISVQDRNWDAIEGLWKLKERAKADPELKSSLQAGETAKDVLRALDKSKAGKQFRQEIDAYARQYGYKTLHCHEFMYKQWIEDVTPIVETIRGYLSTDYDFPAAHQAAKDDQAAAVKELRSLVPETATAEQRARLDRTLELVLRLMPLTPDHHFYLDQGTNARMRLLLLAIGRKMVEAGLFSDPEDVFYLEYDQLRWYAANPKTAENPGGFDGKKAVKQARRARDEAWKVRPRDWLGTVSHWSLYEEPYRVLWGYPDRFLKAAEKAVEAKDVVKGFGAAPGLVEGTARLVRGLEDFDKVQPGEIMVTVMTNPAWVVLFTKVAGVVCDAGGVLAHPAVVAREFGIPAVVGTVNGTQRIATGDRIRVNGVAGTVEVLERVPAN